MRSRRLEKAQGNDDRSPIAELERHRHGASRAVCVGPVMVAWVLSKPGHDERGTRRLADEEGHVLSLARRPEGDELRRRGAYAREQGAQLIVELGRKVGFVAFETTDGCDAHDYLASPWREASPFTR
jgi:hypothetical protein